MATRNAAPRSAAATAPSVAPERAEPAKEQATPAVASAPPRSAPGTPLVIIRKAAAPVEAPGTSSGNGNEPVATAPKTRPAPARQAPAKPAPKAKPAPAPAAAGKERRKEAEKRERKHRRHSKRVNRRAASLDLKDDERVSVSIEGWSRFRRATLVVTNYRVALVTQVPPQVRWIPLEEVSTIGRRWHGAHSIVIAASTEVLTLQKSKKQMLASFHELLDSEVKQARSPGSERHHADITQEWCDRATQVWDSRFHRLRFWIRRRPAVTAGVLAVFVVGAFFLSSALTSWFSPVR